jgi:hypothetical protein
LFVSLDDGGQHVAPGIISRIYAALNPDVGDDGRDGLGGQGRGARSRLFAEALERKRIGQTTSTIVKFAPTQPATETGPSLVKPAAAPKKLSAAEQAAMRTFERARGAFTGFCKDWEAKLSQRERDNLAAVRWKLRNGWAVGQYLGYGKIRSCTCKRSPRGQPVGELTYGEMNNYLTGKTVDEAKHAAPKSTLATETTEIFGWGKKGWEY